jgi:hypothetical protein
MAETHRLGAPSSAGHAVIARVPPAKERVDEETQAARRLLRAVEPVEILYSPTIAAE